MMKITADCYQMASESGVQPHKYGGKELDRENGLDWYDSQARWYDPALGCTTTMDPKAEDYPAVSPYAWCAGNPVRFTDPTGEDIAVLNMGDGLNQHLALLIQNEQGKWQYYSVNGDNVYVSGRFTGGREFDDLAVGEWESPEDFLNSAYNKKGDKDDLSINHYGFSEAFKIATTKEQDKRISTTFMEIAINEDYDFIGNNCAQAVQRAMESAGLKTYQRTKEVYHVPDNIYFGESGFDATLTNPRPFIPSVAFQTIKNMNPQGKLIKKK